MKVLIECLVNTKEKYEIAPDGVNFLLNRMLKRRWVANYGFVPSTLQADGDELDAYVIGRKLKQGQVVDVLPICMVYCVDNGVIDNKLICAAPTARHLRWTAKRIYHFIKRYKKGSFPVLVSWKESNIRYEVAKCKAYAKLFRGGKQCQY